MQRRDPSDLSKQIVAKALCLGASLAGSAAIGSIRRTPSHRKAGDPRWPEAARSAVILALDHPAGEPSRDWWDSRSGKTPGNRELIRVVEGLCHWLAKELALTAFPLPYGVEDGGLFLKEAAVVAGLGVIGRNNLLVTPRFGSRVRLRALLLAFDPCAGCPAPCLQACPQEAFARGRYDRRRCRRQIEKDQENPYRIMDMSSMTYAITCIKYCRACELACPVGG